MLSIGKSRLLYADGMARLSADITLNGRRTALWFAVPVAQAAYLCPGRADPFVFALLPAAMRSGQELACCDPISARLHYQLQDCLIPALAAAGTLYRPVRITAPFTAAPCQNRGAVGTGFSGGVDSLYTVLRHGAGCEYPLTHLAVFNAGVFEGPARRATFARACRVAARFAAGRGLETVLVDTNLAEALPERFLDVYSFRNIACALALQGLFSLYLLSSGHDIASFRLDLHNAARFDALTVACAATEGLDFSLSGAEAKRWQKLAALSDWPPSWRWLHPCICGVAGGANCGRCKKCARDTVALYALGTLERYAAVFDTAAFRKNIAARMGFVLANRGDHLYDETLALLRDRGVAIPPAAYLYAEQFRRAMDGPQAYAGETAG